MPTKTNSAKNKTSKSRKEKIPSTVRNAVWNKYIGDCKRPMCFCCSVEAITRANFECGHVLAEAKGGKVTLENLRPVCGNCNKSMGTRNMEEFMAQYGFQKTKHWNGYRESSRCTIV